MAKKIEVMITAFRDGFQSAYGARVLTPDFMPAVEAARDAGIRHFEAGGGARFQSLFFYCNESAFDMMDTFRDKAGPDADLQTLARGINVVALDSQLVPQPPSPPRSPQHQWARAPGARAHASPADTA